MADAQGQVTQIGTTIVVVWIAAALLCRFWAKRRARREAVTGFWDYGTTEGAHGEVVIVVVDMDGAGQLACATTPGDQLKHLECPLVGPCHFIREDHR